MTDILTPRSPFLTSQVSALHGKIGMETDPIRKSFKVREWIHWLTEDVQHRPGAYSNGDTLDILRDAATEFRMDYKFVRDAKQPHVIIILVKSPEEPWNYESNGGAVDVMGRDNQYMGWVDRSRGAGSIRGSKA